MRIDRPTRTGVVPPITRCRHAHIAPGGRCSVAAVNPPRAARPILPTRARLRRTRIGRHGGRPSNHSTSPRGNRPRRTVLRRRRESPRAARPFHHFFPFLSGRLFHANWVGSGYVCHWVSHQLRFENPESFHARDEVELIRVSSFPRTSRIAFQVGGSPKNISRISA
jgi:hypothetical protein